MKINTQNIDILVKNKSIRGPGGQNESALAVKTGSIIEAVITNKTKESVTLRTQDSISFETNSASVKGSIGDTVKFEVISNQNDKIKLKQVFEREKLAKQAKTAIASGDKLELMKKTGLYTEKDKINDSSTEAVSKAMRAIAAMKNKLSLTSNSITRNVISELIAAGISLDKISLDMLSGAVAEADDKLAQRPAQFDINGKSPARANSSGYKPEYVSLLEENGLPASKRNLDFIKNAYDKLNETDKLDNSSIADLVKKNKALTLENIYISKFTNPELDPSNSDISHDDIEIDILTDKQWEDISPELEKQLKNMNLARFNGYNKDNALKLARALIENDVEINSENISKAVFLQNLGVNIDRSSFFNNVINALRNGNGYNINLHEQPINNDAAVILNEKYQGIIRDLPSITDSVIARTLYARQNPTISQFRDEVKSDGLNAQQAQSLSTEQDIATTRRQFAEISFKLTYDTARRLSIKGIDIDYMKTNEALSALREAEKEVYASKLNLFGAGSTENTDKIGSLFDSVNQVKLLSATGYVGIIQKRVAFNIDSIAKESLASADNMIKAMKAAEDYEEFLTVPIRKYGDSFSKIKTQFNGLLETMNLEATEQNVRAAAILSRSKTDVNIENLTTVKLIDSKLNQIVNRLHPVIAADMIKEGLNPVEMDIDEVLEHINKFNNKYGDNLSDKISSAILEMDKANAFPEDTRSLTIDFYRMLHQIGSNGGVSLGIALKNETNLTLGDLFTASKYYQKTKNDEISFDFKLNDQQSSLIAQSNILSRFRELNSSNPSELTNAYNNELTDRLSNLSTEHSGVRLRQNLQNDQKFLDSENSIEKMVSDMEMVEVNNLNQVNDSNSIKISNYYNMIRNLEDSPPVMARWMEQNSVSLNPETLNLMKNAVNNQFLIGNTINDVKKRLNSIKNNNAESKNVLEFIDSTISALENGAYPNEIISGLSDRLSSIINNSDDSETRCELTKAVKVLSLFSELSAKGQYHSLPVSLKSGDEKISSLNMYVLNDNPGKEATAVIALDTANLGNIMIHMSFQDNKVNLRITNDSYPAQKADILEFLRSNGDSLAETISQNGYDMGELTFEYGN